MDYTVIKNASIKWTHCYIFTLFLLFLEIITWKGFYIELQEFLSMLAVFIHYLFHEILYIFIIIIKKINISNIEIYILYVLSEFSFYLFLPLWF